MRIVEKLLYGVCGVIGLMLLFILLCHLNPNIAKGFAQTDEVEAANVVKDEPIENVLANDSIINKEVANTVLGTSKYEAPAEDAIKVPTELISLMGMEIPFGKEIKVTKDEAEEIISSLDKGKTGEDYTYEEKYYPYYYMLDDIEKALYRQIHASSQDLIASFLPVNEEAKSKQLQNAFVALVNDHPELFWLNTGYGYKVDPEKKIVEIDLSYNHTAADKDSYVAKFEDLANKIIYGSRGAGNDYDKEVFVHDELCRLITYDLNAPANQSAYSGIVTERTVCAGYARAFQYLMQKLEIPCYYCAGYSGENHAWNIIKLNGDYYNVDVTWGDQEKRIIYDYFNCSDKDYATTHIRRDLSINLPPCLGTEYAGLEKEKDLNEETKTEEKTDSGITSKEEIEEKIVKESQEQIATTNAVTTQEVSTTIVRNKKTDYPIFKNLKEYNVECAHRMMEDNDNSVTYTLYLKDEKLWEEVKNEYIDGNYESAYMDRILAERHASGATVSVSGQVMDDGTVKVKHTYQLY